MVPQALFTTAKCSMETQPNRNARPHWAPERLFHPCLTLPGPASIHPLLCRGGEGHLLRASSMAFKAGLDYCSETNLPPTPIICMGEVYFGKSQMTYFGMNRSRYIVTYWSPHFQSIHSSHQLQGKQKLLEIEIIH